ncbi:MAG: hypothetical protein R3F61_00230 [Myxococcota bacterium]
MAGIPAIYADWLGEALPGPVRGEARSTCEACPLCEGRFRVDVKCCGYVPRLPNYLVGRVLRAGGRGAETVRARLDARVSVTPLGLGIPPDYAAAWTLVERTTGFGTDPELVCPHFDDGRCSIWANREAVCTTWFCRLDRGAVGQAFWLELRAFLQLLERVLARHALRQVGIDPSVRPVPWGRFVDDREALFLATADAVAGLSWSEVRELGGFELSVRRRALKAAWLAREHPAPVTEPVVPGVFTASRQEGRAHLVGWSEYDALDLPDAVLDQLDDPASLPTEVVRALVDHGILVEAHQEAASRAP